jgi:hypothetical protein
MLKLRGGNFRKMADFTSAAKLESRPRPSHHGVKPHMWTANLDSAGAVFPSND